MEKINITAFLDQNIGKIKKLNGGNLAPPIAMEAGGLDIRKEFKALNMPYTRLHDAPYENPGFRLVDIHHIFPLFHLDENDPQNYYFDQTDDYIKNCIELGTQIIYRLGESIEWGKKKYFVHPPKDTDKWINICSNIIRHYNDRWGNGFSFDIKYWEIWNEPEGLTPTGEKPNWSGSYDEYLAFYVRCSKELKRRFPNLKIGGPANNDPYKAEEFLNYCKKFDAPVDFYSYHSYGKTIEQNVQDAFDIKKQAIAAGYPDAELHQNEWHHTQTVPVPPGNWRGDKYSAKLVYDGFTSLESGVYAAAQMIAWQDSPLDLSCFYTVTSNWGNYYGIFDKYGIPEKCYYGLKAFGDIVRYSERFKIECNHPQVYALGGHEGNQFSVLICLYRQASGVVSLKIPAMISEILCLDSTHDLTPIVFNENGDVQLEITTGSSLYLINGFVK